MAKQNGLLRAKTALIKAALAYPQSVEEHPWGESAIKVKGKVFVFVSLHKGVLYVTMKLPQTGRQALELPFATPTGYGLGKNGWVTATFDESADVPVEMLCEWMEESFRTIAPKKIVALLSPLPEILDKPKTTPKKRKRRT